LEFRAEPDDAVFLAALREIMTDTLDAHARRTIAEHGIDAAAQEDLDILNWMPAPRDWWRLGYTPDGELAGIAVPSRNHTDPVVAYIGYAYDLLVEATHELVERGADRIIAGTDVTNYPMAAHFAKAGYPVGQYQIDLV
jgi:hypothetical protein